MIESDRWTISETRGDAAHNWIMFGGGAKLMCNRKELARLQSRFGLAKLKLFSIQPEHKNELSIQKKSVTETTLLIQK